MPVAGLISKDASHVALRLPVWRARRSSGSSSAARVREGGLAGLLVGFLLGGESWGRDFGSHVWVEVFVEDFGWERMQLRFHLPSLGPSYLTPLYLGLLYPSNGPTQSVTKIT